MKFFQLTRRLAVVPLPPQTIMFLGLRVTIHTAISVEVDFGVQLASESLGNVVKLSHQLVSLLVGWGEDHVQIDVELLLDGVGEAQDDALGKGALVGVSENGDDFFSDLLLDDHGGDVNLSCSVFGGWDEIQLLVFVVDDDQNFSTGSVSVDCLED